MTPPNAGKLNILKYYGVNNPVSRIIGGTVSNLGAPLAPGITPGLMGLAVGSTPTLTQEAVPYLER